MNQIRIALAAVLARHRTAFGALFPNWALHADTGTELQQTVAPLLGSFFSRVDAALDAVEKTVIDVETLRGKRDTYVEDVVQQRTAAAVREGTTAYTAELSGATAALNTLSTHLERAGVYPRPTPADAAQEAALGNLRADLRMLLDGVGPDELPGRIAALAATAAGNGDELRTWFLAGSTWPADYLGARVSPVVLEARKMELDDALTKALGENNSRTQYQGRRGYKLVEQSGRDSVRRVVDSWLPNVYEFEVVNELAERQPSRSGMLQDPR